MVKNANNTIGGRLNNSLFRNKFVFVEEINLARDICLASFNKPF